MASIVYIKEIDEKTCFHLAFKKNVWKLRNYQLDSNPQWTHQNSPYSLADLREMCQQEGNWIYDAPRKKFTEWQFWHDYITKKNEEIIKKREIESIINKERFALSKSDQELLKLYSGLSLSSQALIVQMLKNLQEKPVDNQ
ncbi:MAG: hypothetical protein HQK72_15005 [Desulfamplus sp.]|nr:hypothetical protein [Desulfamplus sp.]